MRAQEHGLLVEPELADLVEEEHAPVRLAEQARPRRRPGEGALLCPKSADIALSPRSVAH